VISRACCSQDFVLGTYTRLQRTGADPVGVAGMSRGVPSPPENISIFELKKVSFGAFWTDKN